MPRGSLSWCYKAAAGSGKEGREEGGSMPQPRLIATIDGYIVPSIERYRNSSLSKYPSGIEAQAVAMSEHSCHRSSFDPTYVAATSECRG